MNRQITEVNAVGDGDLISTITFSVVVTEPTTGKVDSAKGTLYLAEPVAADADLHALVEASPDYERVAGFIESQLARALTQNVIDNTPKPPPAPPITLTDAKMRWFDSVDATIAEIMMNFTRFQMGYEAREAAAIAYRDAGYTGDPTTWITRFADNTGMTYQAATDLILTQAQTLRNSIVELENLRMDKYLILQAPDVQAALAIYDGIITAAREIERTL